MQTLKQVTPSQIVLLLCYPSQILLSVLKAWIRRSDIMQETQPTTLLGFGQLEDNLIINLRKRYEQKTIEHGGIFEQRKEMKKKTQNIWERNEPKTMLYLFHLLFKKRKRKKTMISVGFKESKQQLGF